MFLALKNGLGRLAIFFRGLLDEYGGAAAAYSLRRLNGSYSGPIVKVRRDADNEEKDFPGTSGIVDWVNGKQESTLPADVATAAAGYSLRKVKADYSGDAVRIRREFDDVEVNVAFDANDEVSDSSAITNVEDISLVSESGFATDTGGFESSISGATFSFGNTLDGKSNVLFATFDGSGLLGLNFSTSDVAIGDVINYSFDVYWDSSNVGGLPDLRIRSGSTTIGHTDVPMPLEDSWYTFSGQFTVSSNTPTALTLQAANSSGLTTGDIFAIANGSYSKQQDVGDTTTTTLGAFLTESANTYTQTSDLSVLAGSGTQYSFPSNSAPNTIGQTYQISFEAKRNSGGSGTHGDVRLRTPSSWNYTVVSISSNLTAETNRFRLNTSSEEYQTYTVTVTTDSGSSESPLRMQTFDTDDDYTVRNAVFNVVGHKATVHTWYDQAGSNDATQGTAASQPKIAEAGALIADGVDFDGVDDVLSATDTGSVDNASLFVVATKGTATGNIARPAGFVHTSSSNVKATFAQANDNSLRFDGAATSFGSQTLPASAVYLRSSFKTLTTAKDFVNGVSNIDESISLAATTNKYSIGAAENGGNIDFDGNIKEVIFYGSDQSSNRFKIDSNINNHYGLYTAAEDGFVETWYDQSGNGNNAVALADTNEPQIVSAGSLLADGIDFDGSDDYLQCTSALGITTDTSAFTVVKLDTTAGAQFIVGNRDGGGDGSIMYNSSGNFIHLFQSGNAQVSSSTNESLVIFEKSATEILVAVNDGTPTTTANTDSIDVTTAPRIGTRSFSSPSSVLDGSIKEIVIYSSIQTANRSNIIDNINDHYSIF